MYKNINEQEFINEFKIGTRKAQYSIEGLKALYKYFKNYEFAANEDVYLDVIAVCCEYTEYENIEACLKDYDLKTIDELRENTDIIKIEGTDRIIIKDF